MIHLVTGGARSGKSTFAQREAEAVPGPLVFVATARLWDDEIVDRVRRHQSDRGARWRTVEAPEDLPAAIVAPGAAAVLVDCLTMWVANLVLADVSDDAMTEHIAALEQACGRVSVPTWIVTNEVGLGIVPDNLLSRRYRDHLGRCNQAIAARSSRVSLMVCGLPVPVKAP
jgi:adenosylcobinamide kinase/adenosylcobinamide-phosphate guanylyltransferase